MRGRGGRLQVEGISGRPSAAGGGGMEDGPWNPDASGWFCAGYGPLRRLGTGSGGMSVSGPGQRFATLFCEDAVLSESEEWLKRSWARYLQDRREPQRQLVEGVKEMLSDGLLPCGMRVVEISVDHVVVEDRQGLRLPLRDASDGCRGIYATILDLVYGIGKVHGEEGLFAKREGRTVVDLPGVVLIDEIEAHLHPAWQREIPRWLKAHFPKIQFLVTTHSPLVVQAADPHGIFTLPTPGESDSAPRRLDPREEDKIRLGRAERTLVGSTFGLRHSRSTWAVEQIERWKLLDAKRRAGVDLLGPEMREFHRLEEQMRVAFEDER